MINPKPSLEDAEKLFPRVEFNYGVVKFLNGGSRPSVIDYHKEIEWPDVMLLALAERTTPLLGRILTGHQVMDLCRLLKQPVTDWLNTIKPDPRPEGGWLIPDFYIDIADDGHALHAIWPGAPCSYDLRKNCEKVDRDCSELMPEEAHLYNMAIMYIKLLRAVTSQISEKQAVHAATTEVQQYQAALAESGLLRDDLGDDTDRHVRDGSPTVVAGNNPAGTAG